MSKRTKTIKIVLVGDGATGKTSVISVLGNSSFVDEYVPTVFDETIITTDVHGTRCELHVWDTAGQEDYDRLRPMSYPGTDAVLLLFSFESQETLNNVDQKWFPEVNYHLYSVPKILVGNKKDLVELTKTTDKNKRERLPTSADGLAMARRIGAQHYAEVSARTQHGIKELFVDAAWIALHPPRRRKPCAIL